MTTESLTPGSPLIEQLKWLKDRRCDVAKYVPFHMQDAICRYIIFGARPGHFLTALLSNDLMEAYGRADDINTSHMRNWVMFLYDEAPAGSYGSPDNVKEWLAVGGLAGIYAKDAAAAAAAPADTQ